jgi:hypothetical protein
MRTHFSQLSPPGARGVDIENAEEAAGRFPQPSFEVFHVVEAATAGEHAGYLFVRVGEWERDVDRQRRAEQIAAGERRGGPHPFEIQKIGHMLDRGTEVECGLISRFDQLRERRHHVGVPQARRVHLEQQVFRQRVADVVERGDVQIIQELRWTSAGPTRNQGQGFPFLDPRTQRGVSWAVPKPVQLLTRPGRLCGHVVPSGRSAALAVMSNLGTVVTRESGDRLHQIWRSVKRG